MVQGNSICVKSYLKPDLFLEIIAEAEKAGKRRKGLLPFVQVEHGFANEKQANTDGISKFLKHCYFYYKEHEAERLREVAELIAKQRELDELKKKRGVL